jgi:UDP-N-acetylmuramoylalanine--D-glutamate ligase
LELDSWQLQGFDDLRISPNIGVFTTFYPDHMDYYENDMNRYLLDKSTIFRHQKYGDALVTTLEITELVRSLRDDVNRKSSWAIASAMPSTFAMKARGQHNLLNAGLARVVGFGCGVSTEIIETALHNFESIEGRLQHIATWNGREFYNDSNATTQEATLAALTAFPSQSIVLIFGGADKELPIDLLLKYISENHIRCVLLSGTGSARVLRELPHIGAVNSMADAVRTAVTLSRSEDNVILSPGFASFGLFKNEYDRSDQFVREVNNLIVGGEPE